MFKQCLEAISIRERISLPTKSLILFGLVAALGTSTFAQTQSATDISGAVTTMVASAKDDAGVVAPTAENPIAPASKPAPEPIGAGSDHGGYVMARGYFFSIKRSDDDPAVISASLGGLTTAVDDFDYGWKSAYKGEVGWNWPGGIGLRASYFYTNQSAQENRNATAGAPFFVSPRPLNVTFTGAADPGTLARFRQRFQLHVIDVEGDYKWKDPNWSVLVSGGLRIGISRQTYTADDTFAGSTENLAYVQERTGYGPTGAIDFRHRIGGGWWWTGSGRFAVLFGDIDERSTYSVPPVFTQTATRTDTRSTWVFEGETGLEWSTSVPAPFQAFVNGSFVYHHWNDLVNVMPAPAIGASAVLALDNPALPPTQTGSISFIGGVFTVGFRF